MLLVDVAGPDAHGPPHNLLVLRRDDSHGRDTQKVSGCGGRARITVCARVCCVCECVRECMCGCVGVGVHSVDILLQLAQLLTSPHTHTHRAAAVIAAKFLPTLKANYTLWPLAHVINFGLIPPEQRILVRGMQCGCCWCIGRVRKHAALCDFAHMCEHASCTECIWSEGVSTCSISHSPALLRMVCVGDTMLG